MPSNAGSGTQAAVIGTEHTLLTTTTVGNYVFKVVKAAMQAGDTLELRIYDTVLSGGVSRVAYEVTYSGVQPADDMISISVPIPILVQFVATLKQTVGTGRSFPWMAILL